MAPLGTPALYTFPSDEVAGISTITVQTGTAAPQYGPTLLIDKNPARVAKIVEVTGAWQGAWGAKQAPKIASVVHHTFDAGADVKIQFDDTPNWTTPAFSQSLTIPTWKGGTGAKRWPVTPWVDLTQNVSWSAVGWLYWRLVVTGNSQGVQAGQIYLSKAIRQVGPPSTKEPGIQFGYTTTPRRPAIENVTAFDVQTIYGRGTRLYSFAGALRTLDSVMPGIREQWEESGGMEEPWLFIPDGTVNEAFYVRWRGDARAEQRNFLNQNDLPWDLREVGRGLRPGV